LLRKVADVTEEFNMRKAAIKERITNGMKAKQEEKIRGEI
jgi:hypothetical protein